MQGGWRSLLQNKKSRLCGKINMAAARFQHHKDYTAVPTTPIRLTETTTRKLCSKLQGLHMC